MYTPCILLLLTGLCFLSHTWHHTLQAQTYTFYNETFDNQIPDNWLNNGWKWQASQNNYTGVVLPDTTAQLDKYALTSNIFDLSPYEKVYLALSYHLNHNQLLPLNEDSSSIHLLISTDHGATYQSIGLPESEKPMDISAYVQQMPHVLFKLEISNRLVTELQHEDFVLDQFQLTTTASAGISHIYHWENNSTSPDTFGHTTYPDSSAIKFWATDDGQSAHYTLSSLDFSEFPLYEDYFLGVEYATIDADAGSTNKGQLKTTTPFIRLGIKVPAKPEEMIWLVTENTNNDIVHRYINITEYVKGHKNVDLNLYTNGDSGDEVMVALRRGRSSPKSDLVVRDKSRNTRKTYAKSSPDYCIPIDTANKYGITAFVSDADSECGLENPFDIDELVVHATIYDDTGTPIETLPNLPIEEVNEVGEWPVTIHYDFESNTIYNIRFSVSLQPPDGEPVPLDCNPDNNEVNITVGCCTDIISYIFNQVNTLLPYAETETFFIINETLPDTIIYIKETEEVHLKAGQYIDIRPGFDAVMGSSFNTNIESCITVAPSEKMDKSHLLNGLFISELDWKIYPNPFNNYIQLDYFLTEDATVAIQLFNSIGQSTKIIQSPQQQIIGNYQLSINTDNLLPGLYYFVLQIDHQTLMKKVIKSQ